MCTVCEALDTHTTRVCVFVCGGVWQSLLCRVCLVVSIWQVLLLWWCSVTTHHKRAMAPCCGRCCGVLFLWVGVPRPLAAHNVVRHQQQSMLFMSTTLAPTWRVAWSGVSPSTPLVTNNLQSMFKPHCNHQHHTQPRPPKWHHNNHTSHHSSHKHRTPRNAQHLTHHHLPLYIAKHQTFQPP